MRRSWLKHPRTYARRRVPLVIAKLAGGCCEDAIKSRSISLDIAWIEFNSSTSVSISKNFHLERRVVGENGDA